MKVKGKTSIPGGRLRGTDTHGQVVQWTEVEKEVDLSDEGYWQVKDDAEIVIVDVDSNPPARPQPQGLGQMQGDPAQLAALASQAQLMGYTLVPTSQAAVQPGAPAKGATAPGQDGHASTVYGPSNPEQSSTGPSLANAGTREPVPPATGQVPPLAPTDAQGTPVKSPSTAPKK